MGLTLGRFVTWVTYVICRMIVRTLCILVFIMNFLCGECVHILVIGQMVMTTSASLLGCKFCHVPPLYISNYNGQIYYVVHRLQLISRMAIHCVVHKHFVTNGKCREFMDEIRRLIVEEVDHMFDVKISMISSSDIQDKFCELNFPNICNLVVSCKHHSRGGYINNILELKSKNRYDYIQKCYFLGQIVRQKVFIFKMSINGVKNGISFITQMQPKWDLQNAQIMFGHVKCVVGWTTMACHVYDLSYYKVMIIMVSDIKSRDTKAQQIM